MAFSDEEMLFNLHQPVKATKQEQGLILAFLNFFLLLNWLYFGLIKVQLLAVAFL